MCRHAGPGSKDCAVITQNSLHGVGRHGQLNLTFARRAGTTVLVENYSRPPLQVMRPITDAAGCLCVYLLSPTGGIVQGDQYSVRMHVDEGAHALFTTQSATKVYRMPDGCAEQVTQVTVGRDGVFEYVPDAAILFADSHYHQRLEVTLQPGALAFLSEVVLPGRAARGERFRFRRYLNQTIVRDDDGLIVYDSAALEPAHTLPDAPGRLEGYTCWGSAYLVGDLARWGITPEGFTLPDEHPRDALVALSPLRRNGIAFRMVSHRLEAIYAAFNQVRAAVRTRYLRLPDAPLRK
ncbi:MAG: urease accessory protein UreD [Pleurocapsa minor GSE-CHR-MK-17-07R]|jgi:urease accessory protein|nr:urease accessory protein UreD [Pleurocapsa minor GSE-CHR-MK 17-07R]